MAMAWAGGTAGSSAGKPVRSVAGGAGRLVALRLSAEKLDIDCAGSMRIIRPVRRSITPGAHRPSRVRLQSAFTQDIFARGAFAEGRRHATLGRAGSLKTWPRRKQDRCS